MKYDPEALTRHVLACAEQGMSQIETAELLRVSPSTIARICAASNIKLERKNVSTDQTQIIIKRLERNNSIMLTEQKTAMRPNLKQRLEEQSALLDVLKREMQKTQQSD